jgi:hypothetical protein
MIPKKNKHAYSRVDMIPGTCHIGYVHPGRVHEPFMRSILQAFKYSDRMLAFTGSSCPRQYVARNENIEHFLKGPAEWYLQIDTDMVFDMTAPDDLLDAAIEAGAKHAAGLCFGFDKTAKSVFHAIYNWNEEESRYHLEEEYEEDSRFYCDATGAAFLLTHRSVLEELDYPWHQDHVKHPDTGGMMGHDLSFSHRVRTETGERVLYCADIKIGHVKEFIVDEDTYKAYRKATA